jgi:tetratricopeptide (TPR) repeat protein
MNTKAILAPFFNTIKSQIVGPIVEKTMEDHFSAPPPHNLEPVHVWKEKARLRLTDLFSGQGAIDKMTAGFDAIAEVLRGHLNHAEYDHLHEEWKNGVERWLALMHPDAIHSEISEIRAECLQDIMSISEETMIHFYEAGNTYFKQQNFHKASEAFYVVISLDHRRYNAWVALGLSEVRNKHWDHALYSFAMASITNISSPYPYIYSAECCLEADRHDEAKNYLILAKESLENSQLSNKKSLLNSISKLQESIK